MTGKAVDAGRIRQGDRDEFESLFRSSYASLVRYARSIIKDHDEAEEIVQDLFFRLWSDREKTRMETSVNGYLFRAVHNKCMHYIEHRKVIDKYTREISYIQADNHEKPDTGIYYRELRNKISNVMRRLPERCSMIFYLNRFEGMKYHEIAVKLGISVKTVEANMGKALKEFRIELTDKRNNDE